MVTDGRPRTRPKGPNEAAPAQRRGAGDPDLPEGILPNDEEWHPRTLQWWQTWRESPQATTFIDTDWDFLIDTALLHHVMWTKGRWEFASEVRLRAAKYGATPEDRARLKLKVDDPTATRQAPVQSSAPNVSDINSRRARLTG
jgi:hypothetical protein